MAAKLAQKKKRKKGGGGVSKPKPKPKPKLSMSKTAPAGGKQLSWSEKQALKKKEAAGGGGKASGDEKALLSDIKRKLNGKVELWQLQAIDKLLS